MELGRVGVWSGELRRHEDLGAVADAAAELEELGYTALFLPTHVDRYLRLPNYTNNLLRHGLTEDDLRDGGSDRLVDAIVAWGDEETIAERVRAHHEAGADHVCIQVVGVEPGTIPREEWRRLAEALV